MKLTQTQAPLSNKPIAVEADRMGKSVVPLSCESKVNDPFTDDKTSIPKASTTFEENLHHISGFMNAGGDRLVNDEPLPSNPPKGKGAGLEKRRDSTVLLQLSDFPSPPNTPLKLKSFNQMINKSESVKLGERQDMNQAVQNQAAIPIKTGSNAPPSTSTKGIKSIFEFDAKESTSPQAFNFNNFGRTGVMVPDSKSAPSSNIQPVVKKLTNFAAEFGKPETSTRPFGFHLPAEANFSGVKAGGSSDGDEAPSSEKPKPWHEYLSKPSDPSLSSNTSRQDLSPISDPSTSKETIPPFATSDIRLNAGGRESVSDIGSISSSKEPVPQPAMTISGQESVPTSTSATEPDALPPPSTDASGRGPAPMLVRPSPPEAPVPAASPELSNQKPLPSFNLEFIPHSPKLRPRVNVSPFPRAKSPVRPVANGSEFVFGSGYKIPPMAFDFDTWSKLSYAARLPDKIKFREGLSTTSGRKPDQDIGDVEESQKVSSQKAVTEGAHLKLTENSSTENEGSESVPQLLETPIKTSRTIEQHGLLTPEATPEPASMSKESMRTQDDIVNTQKISHSLEAEEEQTPVREDTHVTPEPASQLAPELSLESHSACVPSTEESFGLPIIRSPARRYKTRPSAKQVDATLTPPASPETSHRAQHLEDPRPGTPQGRPSATIHRKPVPNPQPVEITQQIVSVCQICGQSLDGEERCNCEHQERIQWENKQAGSRSRDLKRKFKRRAARAVIELKTTGMKMADSMLAHLEDEEEISFTTI
jgi:hypothetical protein